MTWCRVSAPLLTLSTKQAVGLTFKFVLFQCGVSVLVGLVQALFSFVTKEFSEPSMAVNPNVLIVVNTVAAALVVGGQWRKSGLSWADFFLPSVRWVRLL